MITRVIQAVRNRMLQRRTRLEVDAAANRIFSKRAVLGGPFAGLKYGDWRGHGSAVFPKLLGCYEAELEKFLERIMSTSPPLIVDVGCAEGYYAIGCALRSSTSHIVAADLSPVARKMCADMARRNGVEEQIEIMGLVTKNRLLDFATISGGLLILDCEGGEDLLMDDETFSRFSTWSILIEMHEFLVPGIEERLINTAARTHKVEVIDSVDDYRRPYRWPLPVTEDLPVKIRHELYREGRPGLMKWLCASPLVAREAENF